jgi:hypothetical protein
MFRQRNIRWSSPLQIGLPIARARAQDDFTLQAF